MARQNKFGKSIEKAEKALETSKRKHREAFRKAILATYEEYGLALEPVAQGGMTIAPYNEHWHKDLPE